MTTPTAQQVLDQHLETWDMPTLAEQHPEMIQWLSERWDVHFGMFSDVVVLDKRTNAPRYFTTTDVREALTQTLRDEIEGGIEV